MMKHRKYTDQTTGETLFLDYDGRWMRQQSAQTIEISLVDVLLSVPDDQRHSVIRAVEREAANAADDIRAAALDGNFRDLSRAFKILENLCCDARYRKDVQQEGAVA